MNKVRYLVCYELTEIVTLFSSTLLGGVYNFCFPLNFFCEHQHALICSTFTGIYKIVQVHATILSPIRRCIFRDHIL